MDDQISAIWASDDLEKIILGTSAGVIISNDAGKTWEDRSSGIGIRRLELDVSPDGAQFFVRDRTQGPIGAGPTCCSGQNELFSSSDGQNWELVTSQGYGFAIDADGHTLYRAQENNLLISGDNGQTWKKHTFPFWANWSSLGLFAHPEQSGVLYAFDENPRTLFISENNCTFTQRPTRLCGVGSRSGFLPPPSIAERMGRIHRGDATDAEEKTE